MKTLALCLVAAIALALGLWPKFQQDDPKAEIKRKHRDARYSTPGESISSMGEGAISKTFVHYMDMTGYNAESTPEGKSAVRDRLAAEHTAARQARHCESNVVAYGKITDHKGYVTSDDTAIYTVYKFVVSQVYRVPRGSALNAGSEIEVTMPGGMAKNKNGKMVGVEHVNFSWLAPGIDHILHLKYDAEADDYYVFHPSGIYKVMPEGRVVRGDAKHAQLGREAYLAREPNTVDAITSELKSITCK